jgi:subfamily B ATP-binding cassette protein MsbA
MKVIKRLLKYATPLHHYLPEYIVYTLLGVVFGLINFTMLIPVLNILFGITKQAPVSQAPEFSFSINYFINVFDYYFSNIVATKGKCMHLGLYVSSYFVPQCCLTSSVFSQ